MAEFDIKAIFKIIGSAEVKAAFKTIGISVNTLGKDIRRASDDAAKFGRNIAIGITAVSAAIKGTVNQFTNYEDALISVQKVTNLNAEETEQLKDGVKALSVELSSSQEELLRIAAAAGRLGIEGVENILNFTEVGAKLAVAIEDLDPTEAITAINNLLRVTGEGVDNVDDLASVLVELGNNTGTTEQRILELSTEVTRAGALFNLNATQVLGLSAAFAELQLRPQQARAVLSRFFTVAAEASRTGGEALQEFAQISNVSIEEFRQKFEEDALGAFFLFAEGLAEFSENGVQLEGVLQRTGLASQGSSAAFAQLATNVDNLRNRVDLATNAFQQNIALNQEFAVRAGALSFVIKQAAIVFQNLNIIAGKELAPGLASLSATFVTLFETIQPIITETFAQLNQQFLSFSDNLRRTLAENPEAIQQFVQTVVDGMIQIGFAIQGAAAIVIALFNTFSSLLDLIPGVNGQSAALALVFLQLSGGINLLISTLRLSFTVFKTLQTIMTATGIIAEGTMAAKFALAFTSMVNVARQSVAAIVARIVALTASLNITSILGGLAAAFRAFWLAALGPAGLIAGAVLAIGALIASTVNWERALQSVQKAWDFVIGKIKSAIDAVKSFFGFSSQAADINVNQNVTVTRDNESSTPRFSNGGAVRGAGNSTSDSILAKLSHGEYVIRAAAVRKLGLNFLNTLNNGVIPSIKGFASGGLVDALNQSANSLKFSGGLRPVAVNSGGVAATGRPVTLVLPGGGTFKAVATENEVERLQTFLRKDDLKKSNDKPEWVK